MKDYMDSIIRPDARLSILRALTEAPEYRLNESILHRIANAFGLSLARHQVAAEIEWLRDAGLVKAEKLGDMWVATATSLGLDVAAGRTIRDGVTRPSPKG